MAKLNNFDINAPKKMVKSGILLATLFNKKVKIKKTISTKNAINSQHSLKKLKKFHNNLCINSFSFKTKDETGKSFKHFFLHEKLFKQKKKKKHYD